ncbi:siroheme synthase [Halogeometricum borinquense DSM 11551]|uniref:precorrin-2 dehydrogenase n=1 Tax=Halogeometricum borinquense (strain ATCC 700274 / DSM 11551 / JCM 10706 / KCTC 4070 / PR3) TaxID=469382 RepID=E4NNH1_HALBP|nr:bifunctional precorrin-2 dehydrogenase/sirohydrochlorin ferrochelatase [Halogeometricum borinquense]ADQ66325.1 siroheme synthase, N-terminal domain [Halogeometricum borinquense DSM 11551]ELY27685.1 siroheme synthase [Halogeometricum borinquense DSM 11551]
MIPLYHDFTDESVLVFGGGPVGARKARRFAAEANVIVVSPRFEEDDYGDAECVRAEPTPDDVSDWVSRVEPALVVAATPDGGVNDAAERAAQETGALVNRADESAAAGDGDRAARSAVVPATIEDGDVRVAISTGGASPALAKYLRERIESEIDGAGAMAELTGQLRQELRETDYTPDERRAAVRAVVQSPKVWKALRTGESKARQEADRVIRNTVGGER